MKFSVAAALSILLLTACRSAGNGWHGVGGPVPDTTPVKVNDVLNSPSAYVGREIVIEGAPSAVCLKKGCWMLMDNGKTYMRVMFKDHAFVVPVHSAGTPMRVAGTLTQKTISQADARHFLEDQGKGEEAMKIVGDQQELMFVATGVLVGER